MKEKVLFIAFITIFNAYAIAQTNIAPNGTATASCEHTTNVVTKVNDQDFTTSGRWLVRLFKSDGCPLPFDPDGTPYVPGVGQQPGQTAWVEIDFGGTSYTIDSFKTYEAGDTMQDYSFLTWNGSSWDTAISEEDLFSQNQAETIAAGTAYVVEGSFTPVTTTKVRLEITQHFRSDYIRMYELEVFESSGLGVEDKFEKSFSVYPNPVNGDILNIKSKVPMESVEVYNILGKTFDVSFVGSEVNISNLQSGLYFIKVNGLETLKFAKN